MNNQEILDNAPEGATHLQYCSDGVDVCYLKIGENFYFHDDKSWLKVSPILANISSIADINRIAELEAYTQYQGQLMDFMTEMYDNFEPDKGGAK
jgi:hypothetical protein